VINGVDADLALDVIEQTATARGASAYRRAGSATRSRGRFLALMGDHQRGNARGVATVEALQKTIPVADVAVRRAWSRSNGRGASSCNTSSGRKILLDGRAQR